MIKEKRLYEVPGAQSSPYHQTLDAKHTSSYQVLSDDVDLHEVRLFQHSVSSIISVESAQQMQQFLGFLSVSCHFGVNP